MPSSSGQRDGPEDQSLRPSAELCGIHSEHDELSLDDTVVASPPRQALDYGIDMKCASLNGHAYRRRARSRFQQHLETGRSLAGGTELTGTRKRSDGNEAHGRSLRVDGGRTSREGAHGPAHASYRQRGRAGPCLADQQVHEPGVPMRVSFAYSHRSRSPSVGRRLGNG